MLVFGHILILNCILCLSAYSGIGNGRDTMLGGQYALKRCKTLRSQNKMVQIWDIEVNQVRAPFLWWIKQMMVPLPRSISGTIARYYYC